VQYLETRRQVPLPNPPRDTVMFDLTEGR